MDPAQVTTETQDTIDMVEQKRKDEALLTYQQELWIDYNAVGGFITNNDGTIERKTIVDFAAEIGIDRGRLYAWKVTIPNFWDRVNARRKELGGQLRVQRVWAGLYLKASAGNPQAAAIFLANHDPEFKMPLQKTEHDVGGGLADLLQAMRKRQAVEAKVIDVSTDDQPNNNA